MEFTTAIISALTTLTRSSIRGPEGKLLASCEKLTANGYATRSGIVFEATEHGRAVAAALHGYAAA